MFGEEGVIRILFNQVKNSVNREDFFFSFQNVPLDVPIIQKSYLIMRITKQLK